MSNFTPHFVQLKRTFYELAKHDTESDYYDLDQTLFTGPRLQWEDLLKSYRIIILSEAGSGKTEEIRQTAKLLRANGKNAFFLRLEHIPEDFEVAFEEGNIEEFNQWLASMEEGWLFLDSIDEARLRSPMDFEKAIRKVSGKIQAAITRAHIVLTGRTSSWRAKTDLELCERHLPLNSINKKNISNIAYKDTSLEGMLNLEKIETEVSKENKTSSNFCIVGLDQLSKYQIEIFSEALGVRDTQDFLKEIERVDANYYTTRPQDLTELVEFWKKNGRIGTRLELIENNINCRLEEREQNRRDVLPLSAQRAKEGAILLAAASILVKDPTIQVPDGSYNNKGMPIQGILTDWDDKQLQTLLSRPIFDQAIYGTVRFHHRSVREYLTAEWLYSLIERSSSHRDVEALIFRKQYGIEVIVPTMRPVLPWLAIRNQSICESIVRIAPQVLLEGGEPSVLQLEIRTKILKETCKNLSSKEIRASIIDYGHVQRFANIDLSEEIRSLFREYEKSPEVVGFLVRMVWQGKIIALKDEIKKLALSPNTDNYIRRWAIRALHTVGGDRDMNDLRKSFIGESEILKREWLSEIVSASEPNADTLHWLLNALTKVEQINRFSIDPLEKTVINFLEKTHVNLLPELIEAFNNLLETRPFNKNKIISISEDCLWLIKPAYIAVKKLAQIENQFVFNDAALSIIQKFNNFYENDHQCREQRDELREIFKTWKELNRAAFWYDVKKARESEFFSRGSNPLTNYRQAQIYRNLWKFGKEDFCYAIDCIKNRPTCDDKLVALTLAFDIYNSNNSADEWRQQIEDVIEGVPELQNQYALLVNPPQSEIDREIQKWNREDAEREIYQRKNLQEWKDFLSSNLDLLRDPKFEDSSSISKAQWYLHQVLRQKPHELNRWTTGRWRELIPEYGKDVAQAYRDGVVNYWRKNHPALLSEGAPTNSTPISVIFGLSGLDIESSENPDWLKRLSNDEVNIACRYAMHELNGFPAWFPGLFDAYPCIVGKFLLDELKYEIDNFDLENESHYLLSDISQTGRWLWDWVAPFLLNIIKADIKINSFNLENILKIILGCSAVDNSELAHIAAQQTSFYSNPIITAIWYAVWVGIGPEQAIPALKGHLENISDHEQKTKFSMMFITRLEGSRRSVKLGGQQCYASPHHLKELFLLIHKYIRVEEDIDRTLGGVYSPELRDDAQEARNALLNHLRRIPGKEAYDALVEIANEPSYRMSWPWLAEFARVKAEQDADIERWTVAQVREFHDRLLCTPSNHRELADFAIRRLLDMKDDLENGDESLATVLQGVEDEIVMRKFLANQLREKAQNRYSISQEYELADNKRPDLRFQGVGFDSPVPAELKLSQNWTGTQLFDRLENQLVGDYLRDNRSSRGIFILVNLKRGKKKFKKKWKIPSGSRVDFNNLIIKLQSFWNTISCNYPHVDEVSVIGIDLSKRFE